MLSAPVLSARLAPLLLARRRALQPWRRPALARARRLPPCHLPPRHLPQETERTQEEAEAGAAAAA